MSKDAGKSNQPIPSQSSRPPRMKSIPNRLHYGIDRSIRGIPQEIPEAVSPKPKKRDVSIKEPIPSPANKKKRVAEQSKAQGKQPVVPRKVRSKRASSNVSPPSESSESSTKSSETKSEGDSPYIANAVEEIKLHKDAPEGFTIAPVPLPPALNAKFKDLYASRNFCAVVSVNLDTIRQECNVNLSPWLGPYESFISIEAAYYTDLVKLFYFNMVADNILDADGTLVEERVTTTVKGVTFTLSASIINQILRVINPPPAITPTYSNEEVYSTLIPGKAIPDDQKHHLSFKPAEMSPINRVMWYIWSRNFVQKGGSFTHMSPKDYRFFTAFVRKHPLNIGQWIFKEMSLFRFVSRKTAYVPFPSLVSLILFYHKIWYVGPPDKMKYIPPFGKSQFNFMKITFEAEGSGQSRAPQRSQARASQRSQARASQSMAQEAQSALAPLFNTDQVKQMIDAAIASLFLKLQFEFGRLGADIKMKLNDVVTGQAEMQSQLAQLKEQSEQKQGEIFDQLIDLDARQSVISVTAFEARDKIDKLIDHFNLGGSSYTFGFTTAPSTSTPSPSAQPTSPSFAFTSPPLHSSSPAIISTPATVVLPSPSTPVISTPSTEILHPTSPTVPPHIDDAKGGEGLN